MGLLKDIAVDVIELPATIFSKMVKLFLGATERYEDGSVKKDKAKQPIIFEGLLGLLLNGIGALGRGISDFIADHKKAISIAFWASATLGGAVALTLYLWPAALAAIASYLVYGYSIAGIVGANPLLQIGFAAGLAFAATSVTTYVTAAVANVIITIKNACSPQQEDSVDDSTPEPTLKPEEHDSSVKLMRTLNVAPTKVKYTADLIPVHTASIPTQTISQHSASNQSTDSALNPTAPLTASM